MLTQLRDAPVQQLGVLVQQLFPLQVQRVLPGLQHYLPPGESERDENSYGRHRGGNAGVSQIALATTRSFLCWGFAFALLCHE
jgi:hypothetical protein